MGLQRREKLVVEHTCSDGKTFTDLGSATEWEEGLRLEKVRETSLREVEVRCCMVCDNSEFAYYRGKGETLECNVFSEKPMVVLKNQVCDLIET